MYFFLLQIWNIGHISVSVLAARHDSSSAPAANSRRKEWQLAWRCCCRRQPTTTATPMCADPGAPPPDPLPQLGVCTISFPFPFPFLIRFDDSRVGCVPCVCSIIGAGGGQELLISCSKVSLSRLPMLVQCSFQLLVGKDLVLLFPTSSVNQNIICF